MATPVQRFGAVLDALTDPVVLSSAQRLRVANAVIAKVSDAQLAAIFPGVARASLDNAQRATVCLWRWLEDLKTLRRQHQVTSTVADLEAATTAAIAVADADFAQE